jgi:hypothetical protein
MSGILGNLAPNESTELRDLMILKREVTVLIERSALNLELEGSKTEQ